MDGSIHGEGPGHDGVHLHAQENRAKMVSMRLPWSLSLCLLVGSCSDSPQAPAEECPDNQVTLTVSSGSVPIFSWEPACGIASLDVFPAVGGASTWVLYAGQRAAENPFRSGIRYGRAPAGALEVTGPSPLASGTEYTIVIYRLLGETGGPSSLLSAGSATFRP
jgi:hypothetical protein